MKKKIKDLTVLEIRNMCKEYQQCSRCPLHNFMAVCSKPDDLTTLQLKSEVEVDE